MRKMIALFLALAIAPLGYAEVVESLPTWATHYQNAEGTYDRRLWLRLSASILEIGFDERDLLVAPTLAQTVSSTTLGVTRPTATVSALPTCNAAARGQMYIVTDALTPVALATVAGGGAVVVPVVCNGANWIVG